MRRRTDSLFRGATLLRVVRPVFGLEPAGDGGRVTLSPKSVFERGVRGTSGLRPPRPPPPASAEVVPGRESGLDAALIGPDFWSGLIAPRGHWLIAARSRPPIGRRHRRLRERPPSEIGLLPSARRRAHRRRRSARRPPHGRSVGRSQVESRSSNDGSRSEEQKSRSLPAAPKIERERGRNRQAGGRSLSFPGRGSGRRRRREPPGEKAAPRRTEGAREERRNGRSLPGVPLRKGSPTTTREGEERT